MKTIVQVTYEIECENEDQAWSVALDLKENPNTSMFHIPKNPRLNRAELPMRPLRIEIPAVIQDLTQPQRGFFVKV